MESIINQLLGERAKIDAALDALRGPRVEFTLGPLDVAKAAAEPPSPTHRHSAPAKRKGMSATARAAQSGRMRLYWAAKRKGKKVAK